MRVRIHRCEYCSLSISLLNYIENPRYNQTKSTTAQTVSDEPAADVLGEATGATIIKETCAFVGAGGILLPYYNQTCKRPNEISNTSNN